MKYVSIDIETTGLDYKECQIIEFAAVLADVSDLRPVEELPFFHSYIYHEIIKGEPYALALNSNILKRLSERKTNPNNDLFLPPSSLGAHFADFLNMNGVNDKIVPAGKNFGSFDRIFLNEIPGFRHAVKLSHRCLDVGNLYFNPDVDDNIPDLKLCMERAAYDSSVPHRALEDARIVVKLIRRKFN